ncbi:MAG: 23S rRNA (guanosine(2251)-2'-O)-methyltransferase RlmB, partial [Thermodesulfobacteriota bacterium]
MKKLIYGIHPVEEALKSNLPVKKILVGTQKPSSNLQTILHIAQRKKIHVVFTQRESLEKMSRGGVHQNVVAILEDFSYGWMDEILSHGRKSGSKALLLILDGIQDPQNFGSIIRTALGCGVNGILIPKDRAVGVTPVVAKASAGAVAHLPIGRVINIANTIDHLKKEGIWVYGASEEAKDRVYDLDLNIDLAIVIGGEGKGIRPLVKQRCDRLFSIPMKGPVSSFNVSVSAGII